MKTVETNKVPNDVTGLVTLGCGGFDDGTHAPFIRIRSFESVMDYKFTDMRTAVLALATVRIALERKILEKSGEFDDIYWLMSIANI